MQGLGQVMWPTPAGATSIEAHWLPEVAAPLCTFSGPLLDPPPTWDRVQDKVLARYEVAYGGHSWPLPHHNRPHPDLEQRCAAFASALLEGRIFPALNGKLSQPVHGLPITNSDKAHPPTGSSLPLEWRSSRIACCLHTKSPQVQLEHRAKSSPLMLIHMCPFWREMHIEECSLQCFRGQFFCFDRSQLGRSQAVTLEKSTSLAPTGGQCPWFTCDLMLSLATAAAAALL